MCTCILIAGSAYIHTINFIECDSEVLSSVAVAPAAPFAADLGATDIA